MNFFNPSVTFKGTVSCDNAPSANSDLTRKQDIAGLSYISSIAAGSSSMLSVDGSGALSIDSLAITDVHVDSSQTSLANFISNESSTAASLKEGDVLILTNATGGTETWIVSGANGSSAGNYTKIESSLTAAEVGAVLQAGDGITVNAGNATISANIAAGSGLSSSVSGGQITFALNANSDLVSEGSSNLYFTQARSRSALSVASVSSPEVQLLTYNSGTGAFSVPLSSVFSEFSAGTGLSYADGEYSLSANTDQVSEGSSNLYYTDARARAAMVAGTGISYTSGTGTIAVNLAGGTGISVSGATIAFNGSSDVVSEGSSNLYFTDARARSALGVDTAGAGDSQVLSYTSGTGKFSLLQSTLRSQFSAGTALGYSNGQFSFTGSTSDVSEGTNQYFTQARSRSALSVASVSSPEVQLLNYNSGTGAFSVPLSSVFSEFSAGTGLSYADGEYALNATTSNVAEGANLYYTDARVRAAISAGSQSDELINYNSSNGSFSLRENQLRYETQLTLSAGVSTQITHNLGKKLVQFVAMDSAGNMIQLDVVFNSTSQLTVTSQVGITADIALSI
tara:strand:+ start:1723 stop:3426 length:1704 start_codon:yes stop_codon:yes gene_type:complete